LQEMHLTFPDEFRCHFIWYQCFRCTIRLQVISAAMISSVRNSVTLINRPQKFSVIRSNTEQRGKIHANKVTPWTHILTLLTRLHQGPLRTLASSCNRCQFFFTVYLLPPPLQFHLSCIILFIFKPP
jgi:hypothetical protein